MNKIEQGLEIAANVFNKLPDDLKEDMLANLEEKLNAAADKIMLKEAKERIAKMTDDDFKLFIPHIYQRRIMTVDYDKLWDSGVRLLSFDIDDTIIAFWRNVETDTKYIGRTKELFDKLKEQGFTIILLSNSKEDRTSKTCELVGAHGYIARAGKPDTSNFVKAFKEYGKGLEKSQMVHFGNRMCKDVIAGNSFGCKTCLVRDMGVVDGGGKMKKLLFSSVGHEIRKEMKSRDMWRKHHEVFKSDQYYQLGEKQRYSDNFPW